VGSVGGNREGAVAPTQVNSVPQLAGDSGQHGALMLQPKSSAGNALHKNRKNKMNIEVMKAVWRRIRRPSRKTLKGLPVLQPQPQWDYKPAHKRHGLPLALLVLVAAASTAFGMLGETAFQMYPHLQPSAVKQQDDGVYVAWVGKTVAHAATFVREASVVEDFGFVDRHTMTANDIARFLKPYYNLGMTLHLVQKLSGSDLLELRRRDGSVGAVVTYVYDGNVLSVWTVAYWQYKTALPAPTQTPQAVVMPAPQRNENDCMITATELLHRLASASAWSNIVMFQLSVNGVRQFGHGMAVWKIAGNSKVLVADASGTFELETTSTALADITNALQKRFSRAYGQPVTLSGERFALEQ
jgi:hypothetical protein